MKAPDFNTCTLQEAADYCVAMIVEQGGPAVDDHTRYCVYEITLPSGRVKRCIVGWGLVGSIEFLDEIEADVKELSTRYKDELPYVFLDNVDTWSLLQAFHDTAADSNSYAPYRLHKPAMLDRIRDAGIDTSAPQWAAWQKIREEAGCED